MKTDLNSLKKELGRLTDINYLKKELSRIAGDVRKEVKKFDVHVHLTPQAKARLEQLETRFNEVLKTLRELQKQVDSNLDRFVKVVRKRGNAMRAARTTSKKTGSRTKTSGKKTARKTTRKAAGK